MSDELLRKIQDLRCKLRSAHFDTDCLLKELECFVNERVIESMTGSVDPNLLIKIVDCNLSSRTKNALHNNGIKYIGDLITFDPNQLKRTPNLGQVSYIEIEGMVKNMNLKLGMKIMYWPLGDIK